MPSHPNDNKFARGTLHDTKAWDLAQGPPLPPEVPIEHTRLYGYLVMYNTVRNNSHDHPYPAFTFEVHGISLDHGQFVIHAHNTSNRSDLLITPGYDHHFQLRDVDGNIALAGPVQFVNMRCEHRTWYIELPITVALELEQQTL